MLTHPEISPVRVLHIVGDSRFGGIARIIIGLGRVSRAHGWQVDVLSTDPTVQEIVRQEGMGVVGIDVIRRPIRPWWDMAGMWRLRQYLRRERYQIVHTHTSKGGFVGRLAARLAGVPAIVHTVHGFAFHESSPPSILRFYTRLERMAARWCDRIVSVSEFHRRWALELGICSPQQILAIPNGTVAGQLGASFAADALRAQLGLRSSDLMVFTTARLAADKGLDHLIRAAARLPRHGRRFRFVIAGDGPIRERLERLAVEAGVADLVSFLGFRQDVTELLTVADLVVFPSLREGLSISLLEAMAAGKPIIATSIGCVRDLASQMEMARLVPPADPAALSEAIQAVGSNPALMDRLGSGARQLFSERYTEDRMLTAYKDLYVELLQAKALAARTSDHGPRREPRSVQPAGEVRIAKPADLPGIVAIHERAFCDFFLTRLGRAFLSRYYDLVLRYRRGIVLASESNGVLDGFVCGFLDPPGFYRLMWRYKKAFMLPALLALLRHPSLAGGMLSGIHRIHRSAAQAEARNCELSSIAVAPEAAGRGRGMSLMQAFLARSWAMSAQSVSLTTDADGNDAANAFYNDAGFRLARRFLQRKGRWMNEYVMDRAAISCPETQQ